MCKSLIYECMNAKSNENLKTPSNKILNMTIISWYGRKPQLYQKPNQKDKTNQNKYIHITCRWHHLHRVVVVSYITISRYTIRTYTWDSCCSGEQHRYRKYKIAWLKNGKLAKIDIFGYLLLSWVSRPNLPPPNIYKKVKLIEDFLQSWNPLFII